MKLVEVIFKGRDKFSKSSSKALRGYFGNFFKNIVEFHNHLDQITFNYKSPNIQYRVIDGNLSILGINEGGDILLKSIDSEEKIVIPSNITLIAASAFCDSNRLKEITLPEGVKRIEDSTFKNCIQLENIKIPESVEYIGESVFSNCKSLTDISIPDSITYINNSTFEKCEKLKKIELPKELGYIGEDAFKECSLLKSVLIPAKVDKIYAGAFEFCKSLENVNFEGSPSYIGNSFYGTGFYNNIKEDEFGCKYVLNHLIESVDKKREEVIIKDGTVSIANRAFSESQISSIDFPKELKIIGDSAFEHCDNLKEIHIPEGVVYIGKRCFSYCKNLEKVYITGDIKRAEFVIFLGSYNLKEIIVSKNMADKIKLD